MKFLRDIARKAANDFKNMADEVWDELGDTNGVPQAYKDVSRSAGKYALTSQLLMAMNFPDEAEVFRDSFNITNGGPTGAQGFEGSPIGFMLDRVAEVAMSRNTAAIGTQGYGDVTQTSTIEDLGQLLPMLRGMEE